MKRMTKQCVLFVALLLLGSYSAMAQTTSGSGAPTAHAPVLKTYLIEREIPDAGKLTPAQLQTISRTSCAVLKEMGPSIQWIQSYVTGNKIYCIYKAENAELIKEHAKKGGFPANNIIEIGSVISPATAQ